MRGSTSNRNNKIVIAIDGHSSCGKSTVSKDIARHLQYAYIDSGAMYRAVTLFCLRNSIISNGIIDKEALSKALDTIQITFKYNSKSEKSETFLNGENVEEEIRQLPVSQSVSHISAIKEVRSKMVLLQQKLGNNKGIVMDGRDIGTTVFKEAELKIFMTATPDIRAKRRYDELVARGEKVSLEEIKANIIERDNIDQARKESPLKKADDAFILDSSQMNPEEQLKWILDKAMSIIEE